MKNPALLFSVLFLFYSCQQPKQEQLPNEPKSLNQKDFQKIDFHSHYRYDRQCLDSLLEKWNMSTVLVDVARTDVDRNNELWDALKIQYQKYSDRYYLCTSFAALEIDSPGFAQKIIEKLENDIEFGAIMVKVWKVHGMEIKDETGQYVQIDDSRLQPIWDFLTEKGIPMIAHIAEPQQAWLPLEEGNPHYNYYKNNPQYHAYLHPEVPSWETIIAARDRWIERNPNLIIVAAHMGSMSHDVDMVAERLEKYPNMYVETAARFGDLTGQDSEKVRDFFIKYQDRILYGTDFGFSSPQEGETSQGDCDYIDNIMALHWQYFSGRDSLDFNSEMISYTVKTKSLNLPDTVLRKFYRDNALKILGDN